ncbi:aromatic prenyltransferase [Xylariaceae sp. AK1471]|nr:aromatic prenyltransferase [Xylariaceae sp. AK1471]
MGSTTTLLSYSQVEQESEFEDDSQAFWWKALAGSLTTLLATSGYDDGAQLYYLRWFHRWIPRSLGRRPVNGKANYASTFTYDGSPLELSLNWKEKKAVPTIRFTTEPCSPEAGTPLDPLNQKSARNVLSEMAKIVPGIDLTRFDLFLTETNVPDTSAEEALSKLPPGFPRARALIAFDLEHGSIVAKGYFNPGHKAFLESRSTKDVVFDAIRKCRSSVGSYDASIKVMNDYIESFDVGKGPFVTLLSNDCVADSSSSRVKVYFVTPVRNFAQAKDAFHLGGMVTGPHIESSLKAIESFWCHLFGVNSSDPDFASREVLPQGSMCTFVVEMKPLPELNMEVKMHMPATWLGSTDAKICEMMSTWFQKHGHSGLANRYMADLAAAL